MVERGDEAPPDAVVVVGASAGGVEALTRLVAELDEDLGAPMLVVLHVAPGGSVLPRILTRAGSLPAKHPQDGESLVANCIYIAPPTAICSSRTGASASCADLRRTGTGAGDRPALPQRRRQLPQSHRRGRALRAARRRRRRLRVRRPQRRHRHRPGSGRRAVPEYAAARDRRRPPRIRGRGCKNGGSGQGSCRKGACVAARRAGEGPGRPGGGARRVRFRRGAGTHLGAESPYSCPACGGVLRELPDEVLRFRCRVGHVFGADSLLHAQSETIDEALWMALRALQERGELASRLASRMRQRGQERLAERYDERREEAARAAETLRELLLGRDAESV